ncbi:MAG: hypothetical protein QGG53_07620 [Planctomycetota bacterium]|nr:hypothetical protein [Planctomycetota bacterium]
MKKNTGLETCATRCHVVGSLRVAQLSRAVMKKSTGLETCAT